MAYRQHVNVVRPHVAHHLQNFFVRFTQPNHDAALGRHAWVQHLEFFQQVQTELVIAAGARLLVKPRGGFQIVVHHIGRSGFQNFQRAVVAAPEIGHQNFDGGLR